jgi:ComF family protein
MRAVLDILLPPRCPGCDTEGEVICADCRRPLLRRLEEPAGAPIGLAVDLPDGLVQLEWCAAFTGPVRAALHALKYDGERRLVEPLAAVMADRWRRAGRGGDLLVPVPVHAARRRERGFDQAEELARACGKLLGVRAASCLVRRDRTAAQHALGRRDRAQNVGGAFEVAERWESTVRGQWVVIIDDVTTTGATLTGCAMALRQAGARAVSALTLARER